MNPDAIASNGDSPVMKRPKFGPREARKPAWLIRIPGACPQLAALSSGRVRQLAPNLVSCERPWIPTMSREAPKVSAPPPPRERQLSVAQNGNKNGNLIPDMLSRRRLWRHSWLTERGGARAGLHLPRFRPIEL